MRALKTWVWKQPWMFFFFCCVWGAVREYGKGKEVFVFSSLVQVKFIPEVYTWKRKGWKDSSCSNTSDLFPSYPLVWRIKQQLLKKEKWCFSQHQTGTLLSQEAPPGKGESVFWTQKAYFTLFETSFLPSDPPIFVLVPKGMEVAGQTRQPNQITLTGISLWEIRIIKSYNNFYYCLIIIV